MRIVIAGGRDEADFLIGSLLSKKNRLIVINEDNDYCSALSHKHDIPIYYGDPSKEYVLDEADIYDSDVLIALTPSDSDNLAICQCAKRVFHVRKVICTVSNPKNVEVFKKLGVNTVVSSTYMVSKYIERAADVGELIQSFSIDDDKVTIAEVAIKSGYHCVNSKLKDIDLPPETIIGTIIRNSRMIVPHGDTVLREGDKLLVIASASNQAQAMAAIMR